MAKIYWVWRKTKCCELINKWKLYIFYCFYKKCYVNAVNITSIISILQEWDNTLLWWMLLLVWWRLVLWIIWILLYFSCNCPNSMDIHMYSICNIVLQFEKKNTTKNSINSWSCCQSIKRNDKRKKSYWYRNTNWIDWNIQQYHLKLTNIEWLIMNKLNVISFYSHCATFCLNLFK